MYNLVRRRYQASWTWLFPPLTKLILPDISVTEYMLSIGDHMKLSGAIADLSGLEKLLRMCSFNGRSMIFMRFAVNPILNLNQSWNRSTRLVSLQRASSVRFSFPACESKWLSSSNFL
jgi:hypothetical protein